MSSIRYCHPNVIYSTIRFIATRKKGDVLHTCKTKYLMPMTPCSLYVTPDPCYNRLNPILREDYKTNMAAQHYWD